MTSGLVMDRAYKLLLQGPQRKFEHKVVVVTVVRALSQISSHIMLTTTRFTAPQHLHSV